MRLSKLFAVFVVFYSFLLILPSTTHAQNYSQYISPNTDINVPQDQHTFVQSITIEVLASMICQLSGRDVITNTSCLSINPQTNKIGYAPPSNQPGGVLGMLTTSMGSLYAVPVSGRTYTQYVASNFGLATHAYAQNSGFEQLDYMLRFWRIFRDIAYLGFVLIFVLIGVGIMLRVKIDPRTVMTIQNQLPKIVVTMVLITFSYAIVGFLVDMMWATTYMTINLFSQVQDNKQIDSGEIMKNLIKSPFGFYGAVTSNLQDEYMNNTPGDIGGGPVAISRRVGETFGDIAISLSFLPQPGDCALNFGPVNFLGPKNGTIGNCGAVMFNSVIQWVTTVLFFFIIISAIIVTLFRIWLMLLRSFAYIIIYTALGPLYLFAGIFPNSTFGFDPWIRGILSNLLIYPIVIAIMLAGRILMTPTQGHTLGFNPPLIGTPAAGVQGLGYLIGFSFLLILPEMITMVREALKSTPSKYIAPQIIGGFKAGAGAAAALPSKGFGKLLEKDSHGNMKGRFAKFWVYGKGGAIHEGGNAINKVANKGRAGLRWLVGANDQQARIAGMGHQEMADNTKNLAGMRTRLGTPGLSQTERDDLDKKIKELEEKNEALKLKLKLGTYHP